MSIHLSVYIPPFQPLHPSQLEWDNRNRRWRGIWRDASLLYALEPCYFSIPYRQSSLWRFKGWHEKVNLKSLLVLTDGGTLITQRGHVRAHSSLAPSGTLITKVQWSDRPPGKRWQLTQSESFWELLNWTLLVSILLSDCRRCSTQRQSSDNLLPWRCPHICSIIRYSRRAMQEADWQPLKAGSDIQIDHK